MNGLGETYSAQTVAEGAAIGDTMHADEDRPSFCDCWLVPAPDRGTESLWLVKRRGQTCDHVGHRKGATV